MAEALDTAKFVFINENAELRCGWRVLAFIALSYLSLIVIGSLVASIGAIVPSLGRLLIPAPDSEGASLHAVANFLLNRGISLIAVILSTATCARALEHRSFSSVGFKLHRGFVRDFLLGSLIGTASIGLAVFIEVIAGSAKFTSGGRGILTLILSFILLFVMFSIAAAFEELFFRGFAFQALVYDVGPLLAVVIASVGFGLLHLANPSASYLSTANTILAGIWLSLAYLKTRSLWLPTGLHCAWNLAMVLLFGLPVSGFSAFTRIGLLNGIAAKPYWISGGGYGPEAGIAATIAILLSTLLAWKSSLFSSTEEMVNSSKHGHPEPKFLSIINPPPD